jgi:hypothetical protein
MSGLPVSLPPELPKPQTLVCANCGAELAGEYCATCGQRHEPHVHTVGHFAAEAFESISHADSRLWRTLWLLFARPGFLTREFFAGRRARYLPPFRLYLVLSVILVLLSSMGADEGATTPPATGAAKVAGPTPSSRARTTGTATASLATTSAVSAIARVPTSAACSNRSCTAFRARCSCSCR